MKKVLSIAGSDCSGGAGIQADLKTFSAHGTFGMSVITSVVAENTVRVLGVEDVSPTMIQQQIDAVFEDIPPHAVKIGMLSQVATMRSVAEKLQQWQPQNIVLDPVMYAKNGAPLMDPDSIDILIAEVVPLADVITPNIPEAEKMSGLHIRSLAEMELAARSIYAMGCKSVLIKGGHSTGDATDILYDGTEFFYYTSERIETKNTHGTGCTYSSAIAANLANEKSLDQAVAAAKEYVTTAIRHSLAIGHGHGPTNHFYTLYKNGLQEEFDD